MNGVQRGILAVAGVLLILLAFVSGSDYNDHSWLALVEFFGAIACFVLAASSKRIKAKAERPE